MKEKIVKNSLLNILWYCNSDYANNIIVVALVSRLDHRLGVKQMLEFKIEEDVIVEVIVLTQCKEDVATETRIENMQNVVEKQLQSKETRDENEATQRRFYFFCYFYSFVCFILVLHEKRLLEKSNSRVSNINKNIFTF